MGIDLPFKHVWVGERRAWAATTELGHGHRIEGTVWATCEAEARELLRRNLSSELGPSSLVELAGA